MIDVNKSLNKMNATADIVQQTYSYLFNLQMISKVPDLFDKIEISVLDAKSRNLIKKNSLILTKNVNQLVSILNKNCLYANDGLLWYIQNISLEKTTINDFFMNCDEHIANINNLLNQIMKIMEIYGLAPSQVSTTYDSVWSQADLYDEISGSYYNSIYVPNRDEKGNLIEIKHGLPFDLSSYNREKERPSDFFKRHSQATVISSGSPARAGVSVIDGQIISNTPVKNERPLAYMQDGTLKAFSDTDSALDIIAKGGVNVWGTFYPIVENGRAVLPNTNMISWNTLKNKNPRALIVQLKNGDKQIISVHGRFKRSLGMTWEEMIDFALSIPNVDLAYNLDGGGSTHAILNGQYLTPMYDENRTVEREVADFIYVERSAPVGTDDDETLLQSLNSETQRMIEKFDN